jgi:hypothetical protein
MTMSKEHVYRRALAAMHKAFDSEKPTLELEQNARKELVIMCAAFLHKERVIHLRLTDLLPSKGRIYE